MCFELLKLLGFFSPKLPSFADQLATINHDYDETLAGLYTQLNIQPDFKLSNPNPKQEKIIFDNLPISNRGTIIQNNILLLSRIFIQNAINTGLVKRFSEIKTIKILDIGCGWALNLPGIFAVFQHLNVEYIGVDIDASRIDICKKTYAQFRNSKFLVKDASLLHQQDDFIEKFDLVLIQHPNIENSAVRPKFETIFANTSKLLKEGGTTYATFFYESEIKYFQTHIQDKITMGSALLQQSQCFKIKLLGRYNFEVYVPENYVYLSQIKNTPTLSVSLSSKKNI